MGLPPAALSQAAAAESAAATRWKPLEWNGIRLSVPGDWEPGRIGIRHLVLECGHGPALEVKWAPVKGRFAHRGHLRRIARQRGRGAAEIREWPLPESWKQALAPFDALGFRWDSKTTSAEGAILYCPECRTATLIQFFKPVERHQRADPAPQILASLRDHRRDGRIGFALFDVRAVLPERFALAGQRFEAGRFRLDFADRRQRLSLFRWAPAAALLAGGSLEDFARVQPDFFRLEFRFFPRGGHLGIEGRVKAPDGLFGRLKARLGSGPARWLRLWRLENVNRILGVLVTGRREADPGLMEELCTGYDVEINPIAGPGADPGAGAALHPL
jgi:hypothetical protein